MQSAYGTGSFQSRLEADGIESKCKTQGPNATNGLFGKDRFTINLIEGIVTCPAGITVSIDGQLHPLVHVVRLESGVH